jgi:hypothetical protein
MAKDLTAFLINLRTDLSDVAEEEWEATELERAVERAVSDLSRFVPRELIFDLTLTSAIIEDKVMIDLSDYINEDDGMEELIRVQKVEFPTNRVPQVFCNFDIFAKMLMITGFGEAEGQTELGAGQEIRIYYDSPHVMPEDDESGTIPVFLENTVILAAAAYALFQRALNYIKQAGTDFASARTALTSAATALAKVTTYLEDNTNEDSKYWLTKITTDIAGLRTAILTSLDACNTYLDAVAGDLTAADAVKNDYMGTTNYLDGGSAPDVKKYLDDGDAHLNKIADGGEQQAVPLAYARYAETTRGALIAVFEEDRRFLAQNATNRTNAAMIFAQEAAQRLSNLRSYIEQAGAWGRIAAGFIAEAEQRLADSIQYANIANYNMQLADRFREQAVERRNEAWSIWRDRTQWIGDFSGSSVRQMPG